VHSRRARWVLLAQDVRGNSGDGSLTTQKHLGERMGDGETSLGEIEDGG
jgi:hypothetical protein